MGIRIRSGEKQEAINIMREAAQWLIGIGKPLWEINDLNVDSFSNPPDEFYVMWNENESVASMILSFEDKFIWPNIAPNTSGFIHKLSVKRKYAGKGYSKTMVEHAKMICINKGINYLRLDCDPHREGLLKLYNTCGFSLVETKQLNTAKLGLIDLAMYEMKLN